MPSMTKSRRRRLIGAVAILIGAATTVALILGAFNQNMMYFLTPTQLLQQKVSMQPNQIFRLGGLVGTISRNDGDLETIFEVNDVLNTIPVSYSGVLPDLFREGQGVVVRGKIRDGTMYADEVLAKHDENYLPPEVAQGLEEIGVRVQ